MWPLQVQCPLCSSAYLQCIHPMENWVQCTGDHVRLVVPWLVVVFIALEWSRAVIEALSFVSL